MAYQEVKCEYCNKFIGKLHGGDVRLAITRHYKKKHPNELAEIVAAYKSAQKLMDKYKYGQVDYIASLARQID